ncbi:MAG TPA: histidine--tRNA ligase [Actinomycetota bacterium]|nr:histidine--tRNA ligase [Actinomycetota bacterium]
MTDFDPPRGTQDLLPPTSDALLAVAVAAHDVARLHGYRYVETPAFEHTEVFARTSGGSSDVVTKEMYTFEDKGGRSLTLKPESTAPVVRAYLAHRQELPSPFKAYYVGPNWRHGRPQAGRLREFRVFGIEVLGTPAPGADIEVVTVADRYLRDAGLSGLTLHLNSIGDEACRPRFRDVLSAFLEEREDRLDREHREGWRRNPLRVLDCSSPECRAATEDAPRILDYLDDACRVHFEAVRAGLDEEAIPYEIDHRLVRGLDYYTRTTFEFVSGALSPAQATVCGGGRYDGLAEVLGGEPTPGVGFGLGLERLLLAAGLEGTAPSPSRAVRCFVVALGEEAGREARALVRELRAAGIPAEGSLEDRPLKAQLRMADRSEAEHAALLGDRELREGVVTIRRLADGEQERVPRREVVAWLSR